MTADHPVGAGPDREREARLENENARLRLATLIETMPQLVWMSADNGDWTWASPRWTAYTGLGPDESRHLGWYAAVHPDDQAATRTAWREATSGGVLRIEHRLLGQLGAEARWFSTRAMPVPAASPRGREWLGVCTDVHEVRQLVERHRLKLGEAQRRVREVLALTRSITRLTAATGERAETGWTVEDYAMHLDGRLSAVARTQAMVMLNPEAGVDLACLVLEELRAHAVQVGQQAVVSGPALRLRARAAEALGLAVHELTANAVEHGALTAPDGLIEVGWKVVHPRAGGLLLFDWRERGATPPAGSPGRRGGFGADLLDHVLRRDLGAESRLDIGPEGVRCRIALPLATSVAEATG